MAEQASDSPLKKARLEGGSHSCVEFPDGPKVLGMHTGLRRNAVTCSREMW